MSARADLRPGHIRPRIQRRYPHLCETKREAVAHAVVRTVRWWRKELRGPVADRALEAVSDGLMDWCELARITLDLAGEIEEPGAGGRVETEHQRAQRTDAEILWEVRRLARKVGRTPSVFDLRRDPHAPSQASLLKRFGSIREAMERAGLEPREKGHRAECAWSDDELLRILRDRSEAAGRVPSMADMEKPGGDVYALRFGSYRKAASLAGVGHLYTGRGRRPVENAHRNGRPA